MNSVLILAVSFIHLYASLFCASEASKQALLAKVLLSVPVSPAEELKEEEIASCYAGSHRYEKMERYDDAIKALSLVYDAYPETYTVNARLGWLYYLKGAFANSLSHYDRANKALPESIEPLLGKSLPLVAQEKWDEVERLMFNVILTDHYNYYGNLRLSIALRMQKKWTMSKKVANKMLVLYPCDVSFMVELASAEYAEGNVEKGRTLFKNVLLLDPENVTARQYLKK